MGGRDVFHVCSEREEQIAEIDRRLKELQQEILRLANGKKEYGDVVDEIHKLREQRQYVLTRDAKRDGRRQRIEEMRGFLEKQVNESLAYDEQLVWRLLEKIIVYENRLTVEFKPGLEIDVEE